MRTASCRKMQPYFSDIRYTTVLPMFNNVYLPNCKYTCIWYCFYIKLNKHYHMHRTDIKMFYVYWPEKQFADPNTLFLSFCKQISGCNLKSGYCRSIAKISVLGGGCIVKPRELCFILELLQLCNWVLLLSLCLGHVSTRTYPSCYISGCSR